MKHWEGDVGLRWDASEAEEETPDLFSNPPQSSFFQQISTGSNTDSDLRVIRVTE